MIGSRRLMDDWMISYFFFVFYALVALKLTVDGCLDDILFLYYLLCFMSYALELTVDGWLDDILFLRLSKCISQIWYKAVFVINTFWMHLNWSLSVLFVFMPQGIAQTSWLSCTRDLSLIVTTKELEPADYPDVSFIFVCWQTNIRNTNQLSWTINFI